MSQVSDRNGRKQTTSLAFNSLTLWHYLVYRQKNNSTTAHAVLMKKFNFKQIKEKKKRSEETGVTLTPYNIVLCYIIITKYRMQSFYNKIIIRIK